jgi:hypothetical protein
VCKEFYEDSQTLLAQISGSLTSIGKFAEISKLASRIRILSKNKKIALNNKKNQFGVVAAISTAIETAIEFVMHSIVVRII